MCECFFFNDTATTEIYTLSLHDALPISGPRRRSRGGRAGGHPRGARGRARLRLEGRDAGGVLVVHREGAALARDRKSTRLNSSHANISYAVFCLKKKKIDVYFNNQ